jgi:hypothetical protein
MDPGYWRPKLERLEDTPRHLVVLPRPDLARPGVEVCELRLRAHDGERLRALLGRPAYCLEGESLRLRPCECLESAALDWEAVAAGASDLVFQYPAGRRLEDRVMDVVRVCQAACTVEGGDGVQVEFRECQPRADELQIARLLQQMGWL